MNYKTPLFVFFCLLLVIIWPEVLVAATPFKTLVGIPGISNPELAFSDYINALYALSISVAALLAVIKIIIAGMKYMLSDIVTSKQQAIGDIKGAVLGLLVVISAVLVLTVINPSLTSTDIILAPVEKGRTNTAPPPAPAGPVLARPITFPCDITSVTNTTSATTRTIDCAIATASCGALYGRSNQVVDNVICSFGRSVPYSCPGRVCTTPEATCRSGGGTPYILPGGASIDCVLPY